MLNNEKNSDIYVSFTLMASMRPRALPPCPGQSSNCKRSTCAISTQMASNIQLNLQLTHLCFRKAGEARGSLGLHMPSAFLHSNAAGAVMAQLYMIPQREALSPFMNVVHFSKSGNEILVC